MPDKTPTINLIDFRKNPRLYMKPEKGYFQIESMKDTIEFQAGSFLNDQQVESLITQRWKVNIRKPKDADYK